MRMMMTWWSIASHQSTVSNGGGVRESGILWLVLAGMGGKLEVRMVLQTGSFKLLGYVP